MSKPTIAATLHGGMHGLERRHRLAYRVLRKTGFQRHDANLIVYGMVLEAGTGEIAHTLAWSSR